MISLYEFWRDTAPGSKRLWYSASTTPPSSFAIDVIRLVSLMNGRLDDAEHLIPNRIGRTVTLASSASPSPEQIFASPGTTGPAPRLRRVQGHARAARGGVRFTV